MMKSVLVYAKMLLQKLLTRAGKARKDDGMEENITLCPPWDEYVARLEALFKGDDDVLVQFDRDEMTVFLRVNGDSKAQAWDYLLPAYLNFGNVTLSIVVTPSNENEMVAQIVRRAFEGNKALSRIETIEGGIGQGATFVVFKPEVIQYKNDDIGDINRVRSLLMEDLVQEVLDPDLGQTGIFFNTELV